MTRKEEIREAALDQRSGLLPVDDAQMIELIDFILELTAPESSPAPLESQEELLYQFTELAGPAIIKYYETGKDEPYDKVMDEILSKFHLTRRTEGKQEELWKEAINNLNISELGSEENVLKELVSKWILIKRTANK